MKALFNSFLQFCSQIRKDSMLLVVCIAPILCGFLLRFGTPFLETLLTDQFNRTEILEPYYLLIDLFLVILTPYMFCFASAMVILGEIDDHISNYMAVTPVGKRGYLISRLGFPALISTLASVVLVTLFSLTSINLPMLITLCLLSSALSILISMLIISVSSNKVEGMAISKLAGLVMIGLFIPFFLEGKTQFLFFFLPSFWIGKLGLSGNYIYVIGAVLTLMVGGTLLYKQFIKKFI